MMTEGLPSILKVAKDFELDNELEKRIEKGIEKVALNMIQDNVPDEIILNATKLTSKELNILKKGI